MLEGFAMSSTSGKDAGRVPTSEKQDSVPLPKELDQPPFAIEPRQGQPPSPTEWTIPMT
jgi:hypothetical protein